MAETSREKKEGAVMVIGAGVAGIRATIDLAAVGYQVLLTDDSKRHRELLARLASIGSEEHCSLCELSLPEAEHYLAAFFCMRRNLLHYETVEFVGEVKSINTSGERFELELASDDDDRKRQVDALIVAGNTLDDDAAGSRLAQLREALGSEGVFGCGAAVKATDVEAALVSGSAAAGACSRYLQERSRRPATAVPRVERQPTQVEQHRIPVVQQAVIIGGGLGGLFAAHALAARGIEVQLIIPPDVEFGKGVERELVEAVAEDDRIRIHRPVEILQSSGTVGRFLTVIRCDGAEDILLPHGATIIADSALKGWPGDDSAVTLAKRLGVELNEGTLQSATKWKPVDSVKRGVYLVTGRSPDEIAKRAEAAAHRAYRYLCQQEIDVPRAISRVSAEVCSRCESCLYLCPYEARVKSDSDEIVVQERVCEGCGVCAANCPSDATDMEGILDDETRILIESTIESASKILP